MKTKLTFILLMLSLLMGLVGAQPASAAVSWAALPHDGLNGTVRAMVVLGDYLYVGGDFTQTSDGSVTNLNHIARYNLKTKTWSAMDENGLNGTVSALAVLGTDLYAGGNFSGSIGGAVLGNLAKYDTLTNTLGSFSEGGLGGPVLSLVANGSNTLYIGGTFTQTANGQVIGIKNIVKYRADTATWYALPDEGLNAGVYSILIKGNYLYAGGSFSQSAGGATTGLNRVARYHLLGISWSALPDGGLNDTPLTMTALGNDIYFGGLFTKNFTGTKNLAYIAKYDPTANSWSALPGNPLDFDVYSLLSNGTNLYVGGSFNTANNGRYIIKFDTLSDTWVTMPDHGLNQAVYSLASWQGNLFAGGDFTADSLTATVSLKRIAQVSIRKSAIVKSTGANDGWVLESGENTNVGGTMNATATTLRVGDDTAKKQYRSILSFDTSVIPDDAVITSVTLKFTIQSSVGVGNPETIFQGFMTDIRKGIFGTSALQVTDWQAAAGKTLGPLTANANDERRSLSLTAAKAQMNKTGLTQIRLRFKLDDNNNAAANYLSIYSGNAALANRPQLIVQYYIP